MLSSEIKNTIDKNWEACWPVNSLRPIVLVDLFCYLLLFKKLEDQGLTVSCRDTLDNGKPACENEPEELCWSHLKALDAKEMHKQFIKENGVIDFLKNYSTQRLPYSDIFKHPLLVNPTVVQLQSIVEIIKIMEQQDENIRRFIFDYLLHKEEIQTDVGQVYVPSSVVHSIISLLKPKKEDIIFDPLCNNGDLLVSAASYLKSQEVEKERPDPWIKIIGADSDPIQRRIAIMNMMMHGIEGSSFLDKDFFASGNIKFPEKATLIVCNLYFSDNENNLINTAPFYMENKRKDVSILKNILKNLSTGGKAAVIVRNYLLSNNIAEISDLRQLLVEEFRIDAVINLPDKKDPGLSGASLLIINKPKEVNPGNIWFYKMKTPANNEIQIRSRVKKQELVLAGEKDDQPGFEKESSNIKNPSWKIILSESLNIPIEKIRKNNYCLLYNQPKKNFETSLSLSNNAASVPIPTKSFLSLKYVLEIKLKGQHFFERIKNFVFSIPLTYKTFQTTLILLLTLGFSIIGLFFVNKSKAPVNLHSPGKNAMVSEIKNTNKVIPHSPKAEPAKNLSPTQLKAILKDTTGIINFNDQETGNDGSELEETTNAPGINIGKKNIAKNSILSFLIKPNINHSITKYLVIDTTFFHDEPNEKTARKSYLDPLNKNILTPIQDSNGYIYIVYTNKFKRTSKGWINKKDLRPLK